MVIAYVLGTKAQFIKCKYILKYLFDSGFELLILDTGQHQEITGKELKNARFSYKYINLTKQNKNISSILEMIFWFISLIFNSKLKKVENIDYCLIHGDTVSTLIGLILAKRRNFKIIHLESGYKSNNIFRPFPEEIIRNIVTRFSDILVVDGEIQLENVSRYKSKKTIIKVSRNTIYDSILNLNTTFSQKENKLIVTIHRTENIYNKKRLKKLVEMLIKLKQDLNYHKITWYCHDITKKALIKHRFKDQLLSNGIDINELIPHSDFINEISTASLVITDGGSIAEECSLLNLLTVVWRDVVENTTYLNENVILSNYDVEKIFKFIKKNYSTTNQQNMSKYSSPSLEFVKEFQNLLINKNI